MLLKIVAFSIIFLLFAAVILLYVLNKRTPLPEGCEDIKIDSMKCSACSNTSCGMKKYVDDKSKEGETIDKQ